jgi:hypothetical protein
MKKAHKIPAWFRHWQKPTVYAKEPSKLDVLEVRFESKEVSEYDVIFENDSEIWRLGRGYDTEIYLEKYKKKTSVNKQYKKQLAAYEKYKAEIEKQASEWDQLHKLWLENQELDAIKEQKELYLALKKKFEGTDKQ